MPYHARSAGSLRRSSPAPAGDRARLPGALGRRGEDLAAAHMRSLGFVLLERNLRTGGGEIDLIAFDGRTLVFAEVKTARVCAGRPPRRFHEQPLLRVGRVQRRRLRRLALAWLGAERRGVPSAREVRFDAIGVTIDAAGALRGIEHVEGAW